jgi:chromosome segregation ATPase
MGILKIALSLASLLVILLFLFLWRSAAGDLEAANRTISGFRRDVPALENANKELREELETTQNSLQENQKAMEELTRVNLSQKGEMERLKKSGEILTASLEAMSATLKDHEDQLRALEEKREESCQIQQTETLLSCESDKLDALNKLGRLAASLEAAIQERDELMGQLEQTKKNLENMTILNHLP